MRFAFALLFVAAGCATTGPAPRPTVHTPAQSSGSAIHSEEEYAAARAEYEALDAHDASRPSRRAALEAYLLGDAEKSLDGGHLEDAWEQLKNALTLYLPGDLKGAVDDPRLYAVLQKSERAFARRGAHTEVTTALVAERTLAPAGAAQEAIDKQFHELSSWVQLPSGDDGATDGRDRLIEDLESAARLWPSPFVVDQLSQLYFARQKAPQALNLGRRAGRMSNLDERALRELLAGSGKASTAYDLARLYLRVDDLTGAQAQLKKLVGQPGDDADVRKLIDRAASSSVQPNDEVALATLFIAPGRDDRDVALRVCQDASRRFPNAAEPRLCAGKFAFSLDQLVVAMKDFEVATSLEPTRFESFEALAKLYQARLFQIVSDENLDVKQLEEALKKVEQFHTDAHKRFPDKTLKPSMADALFEVGRGYYNAGHVAEALRYLDRTIVMQPTPQAYELKAQIKLKKGDAPVAVALYQQAIDLPKPGEGEGLWWRAKLRRGLADAYEQAGKPEDARTIRKAALADWGQLVGMGLTPDALAEAGLETAKLSYDLGDRETALASIDKAIDAAPDRGSTYADAIAWLVPRGELDEALDAYHRALGRENKDVSDYLKVYCSLWIVDLARRAGQPEDPLATAYLKSTDGGKWFDELARWATGREPESQLVDRAKTPAHKAESAFYRAMRAYQEGKTDVARGLWKQVLDTDMMAFFEYDMASFYLRNGGAPSRPIGLEKQTK